MASRDCVEAWRMFLLACEEGDSKLAIHLLDCKKVPADSTGPDDKDDPDVAYRPLHIAARWNRFAVVSHLLNHKHVDIHSRSHTGKTALHYACAHYAMDCVKLLLKSGADPTLEDDERLVPIQNLLPPSEYTEWVNLDDSTQKNICEAWTLFPGQASRKPPFLCAAAVPLPDVGETIGD